MLGTVFAAAFGDEQSDQPASSQPPFSDRLTGDEFPADWDVRFAVDTCENGQPLEVARLQHPAHLVTFELRPAPPECPSTKITLVAIAANSTRTAIGSHQSLTAACQAAGARMEQLDRRTTTVTESDWNGTADDAAADPSRLSRAAAPST